MMELAGIVLLATHLMGKPDEWCKQFISNEMQDKASNLYILKYLYVSPGCKSCMQDKFQVIIAASS